MRVEVDGHQYEVPDDATVDEIDAITKPVAKPKADAIDSLLRGPGQYASLGWMDEAQGGWKALTQRMLPESMGGAPQGETLGQIYKKRVAEERAKDAAAKDENPILYHGAGVAAGLAPALMTAGAGAAPRALSLGARLLRAAGVGAGMGGVAGAGGSTAEDAGGVLNDAKRGALVGAGTGAAAEGLASATAPLGRRLLQYARDKGRNVLQGGATLASANKEPLTDAVVDRAAQAGAFTPGGTRQGAAEALQGALDDAGDRYASILTTLEKNGIKGPDAEAVAQKMATEGRSVATTDSNPAVRAVYDKEAAALRATEPNGDFTIPRDQNGRLQLTQGERLKSNLQRDARYGQYTETPQNEARREAASMLRQANEDAIAQQLPGAPMEARIAGGQFIPAKEDYGLLAQGAKAATRSAGQALRNTGSLHKSIAVAEGAATGDVMKMARGLALEDLLRNRWPSTAAWGARALSNRSQMIAQLLRNGSPLGTEAYELDDSR